MTEFGLIGHPVSHSMSKIMHEAAYKSLGLEYSYGLYDVEVDELKLFMENAVFKGLNVTIPLKTEVIKYLDELSKEAMVIGAVNTIEFRNKLIGHNTDVLGFMKLMESSNISVEDKSFLVLGAGGAGRAITFKLAMEGARTYCYDIKSSKTVELAKDVIEKAGVRIEPTQSIEETLKKVDVVINATPIGMHPNIDFTPIPKKFLTPVHTVVDIIYTPKRTRLLMEAEKVGCDTVGGVGMLVHQGAEAFKIWLGQKPPVDEMEEAVNKALGE